MMAAAMEGSVGFPGGEWRQPMTRCECAELAFDEVAQQVLEEGTSLEEMQERTGCGRLCSACLPDLRDHLARRR